MAGSKSNSQADSVLNARYGSGSPASVYAALLVARYWQASTAYAVGDIVVPTGYTGVTGGVDRLYRCTTAGTSGASEPTWGTTDGGTTTSGTATFTEHTPSLNSNTNMPEATTTPWTNYARVGLTNNTTNFPNAAAGSPAWRRTKQNATAFSFGNATISAGTVMVVGWAAFDASSAGNLMDWATTPPQIVNNGNPVSIPVNGMTVTED